ncbi:hypothetical protein KXQ82_02165 [Mucilaginibacter sp. HMF5004]|uniref:YncE family protein n=1 Tax=Mucilaginibacter rivuli TaxID=2857527 RepID=UPI001C6060A1|nr:hypothetical protein [Mucilaginibacter rivuli]MBW4888496.1 hypothetical protein [Mucilaginibacter rivuli]
MKKVLLFIVFFYSGFLMAQSPLLVAVQQQYDSVVVFDLVSKQKRVSAKVGFKPHEVTYDAVTKKCFISNFGLEDYDLKIGKTGNTISVFDPFTGEILKPLYTAADTSVHNGPHGIKVRPGKHRELFVNTEIGGDAMMVYDINNYAVKRSFALPQGTHNFIFSTNGDSLWVMSGLNGVYRINTENGAVLSHVVLPSATRGVLAAKQWLVASCKNEVFLLSKKDLSIVKHFGNLQLKTGLITYSNITNDQKYILAPAPLDSVVLVIAVSNGQVVHRLQTGNTPLNVQVDGTKAYVTHAYDDYIATIDLSNFTFTRYLKAYGTNGLVLAK